MDSSANKCPGGGGALGNPTLIPPPLPPPFVPFQYQIPMQLPMQQTMAQQQMATMENQLQQQMMAAQLHSQLVLLAPFNAHQEELRHANIPVVPEAPPPSAAPPPAAPYHDSNIATTPPAPPPATPPPATPPPAAPPPAAPSPAAAPPAAAPPAAAPPEAPPKKKRKRVKGDELLDQKHLVKALAVELVQDRVKFRSVWGHCTHKGSEILRNHLDRLIRKDPALVNVMKDRNQADPDLVTAALEALD